VRSACSIRWQAAALNGSDPSRIAATCALDALLAVVALDQPRPVVVLTSDPRDLGRLTEEPGIRKEEGVEIARI
jgi:hypothetical protein